MQHSVFPCFGHFAHIHMFPVDTMLTGFENTWLIEVVQKLLGYVFWGVSDEFRGLFADFAGFSAARFNMLALFGVLVSDVRVVSRISNPSGNVLHQINIPLSPLLGQITEISVIFRVY